MVEAYAAALILTLSHLFAYGGIVGGFTAVLIGFTSLDSNWMFSGLVLIHAAAVTRVVLIDRGYK